MENVWIKKQMRSLRKCGYYIAKNTIFEVTAVVIVQTVIFWVVASGTLNVDFGPQKRVRMFLRNFVIYLQGYTMPQFRTP
jgi:hypothetical protein